ncbi:MAG: hypothetical protein LBL21_04490 [Rickettsiales bacterium]|jgi:hypothetical protein|nr:hypothetical protein [Rickettsiales bacterium]
MEGVLRGFILSLFMLVSGAANAVVYVGKPDLPALMRALVASRSQPVGSSSPRANSAAAQAAPAWPAAAPDHSAYDPANFTKQQYIGYLKNAYTGGRAECQERYGRFSDFFGYDSSLGGQISARDGGPANGRMDNVCNFLGYSHWCFALGFAYAVRDLDDPIRTNMGNKCFTYQEYCSNVNKAADAAKVDEYLSRVIDEITVYYTSIKNTTRNTVAITTETAKGQSLVSSTSYRVYDTDTWVRERIPSSEMVRLLCR